MQQPYLRPFRTITKAQLNFMSWQEVHRCWSAQVVLFLFLLLRTLLRFNRKFEVIYTRQHTHTRKHQWMNCQVCGELRCACHLRSAHITALVAIRLACTSAVLHSWHVQKYSVHRLTPKERIPVGAKLLHSLFAERNRRCVARNFQLQPGITWQAVRAFVRRRRARVSCETSYRWREFCTNSWLLVGLKGRFCYDASCGVWWFWSCGRKLNMELCVVNLSTLKFVIFAFVLLEKIKEKLKKFFHLYWHKKL